MKMKKWVMAAALICSPLVFTSCDEMLDNAIEQDTKSTERVAFETQLSQNLKEMQQRVVFESALESTQSLTEFMGGLDAGAFKSAALFLSFMDSLRLIISSSALYVKSSL